VRLLTVKDLPRPRFASLRDIWWQDDLLDQSIVILFEEGRSFTGERSAELHLHGSEAVVRSVLGALRAIEGFRDADRGEFTRRALENDRLGLAEVEGLGALLAAETEAQRRQAMRVVSGRLQSRAEGWRAALLRAMAELEVTVDFADEEVPEEVGTEVPGALRGLAAEMAAEGAGAVAAERIARGFEVAIVGPPNAGKSTLLNRLAGREAALTSETAGTTRDIVEVRMEIGGQLVTLLDTAGIRDSADAVERLGIDRARSRSREADLRVFLDGVPAGMKAERGDLVVIGKADVRPEPGEGWLAVSGMTGQGVDALLSAIASELETRVAGAGLAMTERQAVALRRAAQALDEAADVLEEPSARMEVAADLIRSAIVAIEELVGRIGVEDVLGEIFSEFCIGK
jgi:tRNA modification GTPase